jgi:hypothetical protein
LVTWFSIIGFCWFESPGASTIDERKEALVKFEKEREWDIDGFRREKG